ncbi:MAG: hypothetical protein JRH20_10055 [Deltaproteobacteria bacterium]|nr:hypothetical protein [Deltaproteobacteria bacterium]
MPTLLKKALMIFFWVSVGVGCVATSKPVASPGPAKTGCAGANKNAPKVDPASEFLDLHTCVEENVPASQPGGTR